MTAVLIAVEPLVRLRIIKLTNLGLENNSQILGSNRLEPLVRQEA